MDLQTLQSHLMGLVRTHGCLRDISHFNRVWRNAQLIAEDYPEADRMVLLVASYLHDIDFTPKDSPLRPQGSRIAAKKTVKILEEMGGFSKSAISSVAHAIEAHNPSAGISAETLEAKIIQDADRLDMLGAMGIIRNFMYAGRVGNRAYCEEDPLAKNRDPDETLFAIDHYPQKLFGLANMMNTQKAHEIAENRINFMHGFLAQIMREVGPLDGDGPPV
ncbi:MAG TPA: hypothetical protein DCW68_01680 [Rhodospirillaceae bacterium]|nr:MAG: hypothetical protein A2018_04645 [Alphaproteobacteria bacterium GWF2_58_20]HAU28808.1 hypothetical protein [Rhodospirillaceae bacterium]